MNETSVSLKSVFDGWDGYQASILHAVEPLTPAQLAWRPAPDLRSLGETAGHIALGRVEWFARMDAPGSRALLERAAPLLTPGGNLDPRLAANPAVIVEWLHLSWAVIADTLQQWTVSDLFRVYHHTYYGKVYAVSYQWTIWRILTHDIQHGGQLAQMLGEQGLPAVELGDLGGHLTMPPVVEP